MNSMYWKKKKKVAASERLIEAGDKRCSDNRKRVRKGYVPVLVGSDGEMSERFVVPLRLFKEPFMASLLDMAAQEFGYGQQGILRIPCEIDHFRQVVDDIFNSK